MVGEPVTGIGVSRLHFPVTTLGPGRRAAIWLQGCSIHCPGCVSRDTWAAATSLTETAAVADWAEEQADAGLTGITVSGGEPLDQTEQLITLLTDLRDRPLLAGTDILLYTGYTYSAVSRRYATVLALVDAIISGPYVASKPSRHPWMGSANQVLTLLTGRAKDRFTEPVGPRQLQISADGGRIWMTGIPGRGDLERLQALLAERGVLLRDVSWRP
ncbi:MAG: 4Fe-4S single cluster domain-containing protein [Streptosporangiaceae bacterium]|jgi:anaerobic ribonucleoside-triphosphate reductase activating protein